MTPQASTHNPNITSGISWRKSFSETDEEIYYTQIETKTTKSPWTESSDEKMENIFLSNYINYQMYNLHPLSIFVKTPITPLKQVFFSLEDSYTYRFSNMRIKIFQFEILNSTQKEEKPIDLFYEIERLFALAMDEEFEDGVESNFSKDLISFIKKYEKRAIEELTPIFLNEKVNAEIISEALRWIGRIQHNFSKFDRLWLLERCLFHPSPYIRDGATLGIASMNDPNAIDFLKIAIEKEPYLELREDMEQVLITLEKTLNAANFKKD